MKIETELEIVLADYLNPRHAKDLGYLLNCYAQDSMAGATALPSSITKKLAEKLSSVAGAFSVLCYVDNKPAGLANCFQGFSTFQLKPLINVHDLVVVNEFRGLGLSHKMLLKVEQHALQIGCCKITLEVFEGNSIAQKSYQNFGFEGFELNPKMGKALFLQKILRAPKINYAAKQQLI